MTTTQLLKLLNKYLKTHKITSADDAIEVFESFVYDNSLTLTRAQENECYKEIECYQVNLD